MKIYSLIVSLLLSLMVFGLSGCGGEEKSTQSCKVQVEMDLDTANSASEYQAVATLIDGTCSSAFTESEKSEYKIATYFGEIGLNLQNAGSKLLAKDANMTAVLTDMLGNETASVAMQKAVTESEKLIGSANCTQTNSLTKTQAEFCSMKELSLTVDALSLLVQTGLNFDRVGDQDYLFSFLANVNNKNKLDNSSLRLSQVIGSANCSSTGSLSVFQSLSCTLYAPITQAKSASTMAVVAGEAVTYNGATVTAFSALTKPSSVGIVSGNSTQFDIDANGVFDDTQITGFTLGYASANATSKTDYTTASGNGSTKAPTALISLTNSANVTFTKSTSTFTYTFIQVLVDDQDATNKFTSDNTYFTLVDTATNKKVVNKLIDLTKSSPVVTSGTCDTNFTPCTVASATTLSSTTCYPCPVVNNDGTTMDASSSIADIMNDPEASDNEQVSSVKKDIYCADWNQTAGTPTDKAAVCSTTNATVTTIPEVTAADISAYLSKTN